MHTPYKRLAVASAVMCLFAANAYAAQQERATESRPAAPAAAPAERPASPAQARSGAVDITTWDHAQLREGYSAEKLMDMKARGNQGENIGDVKDMLVDRNGKVTALIVSHGGVFGIGDKELRVPFNQVKFDPKLESLTVPIAKDNVEKYRIKEDRQDRQARGAQQGEMKMSELLDDKVHLRDGEKYGDVKDIIVSRDGQVKAIVVDADGRRGRFAFPWTAEGHDRERNRITYNYERNQIDRLRPFDYSAVGIAEPGRRTAARDTAPATGATPGRAPESGARPGTAPAPAPANPSR